MSVLAGKKWTLLPSILACFGFVGAVQTASRWDAEATKSFSLPDGSTINLEGVCSYDESKITCWSGDGVAAPDLTTKIEDYYLGQYHTDLTIGLRKKNRLVVFSRKGKNSGIQFSLEDGSNVNATRAEGRMNQEFLGWVSLKMPPDTHSANIIASVRGLPGPEPVVVPFSEGSKATYGPTSIELGGAKPETAADAEEAARRGLFQANLGAGKHWKYFIVQKDASEPRQRLTFTLLDKQGEPIKYVDRNGRPVSEMTVIKDDPSPSEGRNGPNPNVNGPNAKYVRIAFLLNSTSGDVQTHVSNVDPGDVGSIRVSGTTQFRVLFKDISLDSK